MEVEKNARSYVLPFGETTLRKKEKAENRKLLTANRVSN